MSKIETTLTVAQCRIAEALFAETYAVTVGKKAKTPTSTAIPVAEFPLPSIMALFTYGVQRKFNDAVGGSDQTVEKKLADIAEMIADFKIGKIRATRAGGESVDPFTAAMRIVFRPVVKAGWIKTNDKTAWKALEEEAILAMIDAQYAALDAGDKAKVDAAANAKMATDKLVADAKAAMTVTL